MFRKLPQISKDEWAKWLKRSQSPCADSYFHLHVTELRRDAWRELLPKLVEHFEMALADARAHFHGWVDLSLDPIPGDAQRSIAEYPHALPKIAKKGIFGEVLAGLFAHYFEVNGSPNWKIPCFLFRTHNEAGHFLFTLAQGKSVPSAITNRTGDDFIAIQVDSQGGISRFLVAESKCHTDFNITEGKKALDDLSNEPDLPVSYLSIKDILSRSPHSEDKILAESLEVKILKSSGAKREDMFVYVFADPSKKKYPPTRFPNTGRPSSCNPSRPLQVVEAHIGDLDSVFDEVFKLIFRKRV